MPLFADPFSLSLQPASFRGVPFEVEGDRQTGGRRVALHQYPFRDVPWPEDLGREARGFPIEGFLIGDDVTAREEQLIAAWEQPGPGLLVHPRKGALQVQVTHFETEERWDQQRIVAFRFDCVEAGQLLYPGSTADTQAATASAADDAAAATGAAYDSGITSGGEVVTP